MLADHPRPQHQVGGPGRTVAGQLPCQGLPALAEHGRYVGDGVPPAATFTVQVPGQPVLLDGTGELHRLV